MEYRRFKDSIITRIDPGEEILTSIREITLEEEIKLTSVGGLGAVNSFTAGVLKTAGKEYKADELNGYYKIVSSTGTINTMKDEFYCHLHMSAGGRDGNVVGGHLNRAVVSATCELVIRIIGGRVDRSFSEKAGLNLFGFHRRLLSGSCKISWQVQEAGAHQEIFYVAGLHISSISMD